MIIIDRIRINGFRSIRSLQMPLGRSSVLLGFAVYRCLWGAVLFYWGLTIVAKVRF